MAKKAKVQPRMLTAKSMGSLPIETAKMGEFPSIGANLTSLSQQMDSAEQAREVDVLRKQAKEKLKKKKQLGNGPATRATTAPDASKADTIPPGTFKNAENELVIGDMRKFQESQRKRKVTVKKK